MPVGGELGRSDRLPLHLAALPGQEGHPSQRGVVGKPQPFVEIVGRPGVARGPHDLDQLIPRQLGDAVV